MEELIIPAPAKINLALDVRGLLENGYHKVEMIMQSISLHDIISLRKKQDRDIQLTCSDASLPEGQENLAYRAAELIIQEKGLNQGVEIHIQKNIPVSAGLAGGSTDAAAVLKGINTLFSLEIGNDELRKIGASIGADVPFCLQGGTVLAQGKGDELYQLPDLPREYLLIVTPPVQVSTARIYQEYDRLSTKDYIPVEELASLIKDGREILWNEGWDNALERLTTQLVGDIKEIKRLLNDMGVTFSLMSGSGPTVFGITSYEKAKNIKNNWPREKDFIVLAHTIEKDFEELWRKYY